MLKVLPHPKKRDKRQVYSIILKEKKEYTYEDYELVESANDKLGCEFSWQIAFQHPVVGIMLIYSANFLRPCTMIEVVYKRRAYTYSDIKWYEYAKRGDAIRLADEFAHDLMHNVYAGNEYLLVNQDLPNE
jgi:hypothetical protein